MRAGAWAVLNSRSVAFVFSLGVLLHLEDAQRQRARIIWILAAIESSCTHRVPLWGLIDMKREFNFRFKELLAESSKLVTLEIPSVKEQNIEAALTQAQQIKSGAEAAAQRAETAKTDTETLLQEINKKIDAAKEK